MGLPWSRVATASNLVSGDHPAQCQQGVNYGSYSLVIDESVDPPRTDEVLKKADIVARMSAMHLTTDQIGGDPFGLLSARNGSE